MLLTSITYKTLKLLKKSKSPNPSDSYIHSILTDNGWVVPEWLIYPKQEVERKMKQ